MQEVGGGIENSMACDETVGIAGHVEDFHALLTREQVLGEDATVHAGHDDVGEEQSNDGGSCPEPPFPAFNTAKVRARVGGLRKS